MKLPVVFFGRQQAAATLDEETRVLSIQLDAKELQRFRDGVDGGWIQHVDVRSRDGLPSDLIKEDRARCLNKAQELHKDEDAAYIVKAADEYFQYLNEGVVGKKEPLLQDADHFDWPASKDLEECVFEALGAASSAWSRLEGAGEFDSSFVKAVGDKLMERIKASGPIYG